jgi:hypothetical protein
MLQERINGVNVATSSHEWFHKALSSKLSSLKLDTRGDDRGEAAESV